MTDHREVMRMALEAISAIPEDVEGYMPEALTEAVIALRAAIDEPAGDWVPDAQEAATRWLRERFGANHGHPEWRLLTDAFCAGWNAHPPATPAADADAITVRLTREQHFDIRLAVKNCAEIDDANAVKILDALGTFPTPAEKGKP